MLLNSPDHVLLVDFAFVLAWEYFQDLEQFIYYQQFLLG